MSKVLITGGAGYIGSHVILRLRNDGHEIVVLDNLSTGNRSAVPSDVELIEGGLTNAKDVLDRSFDAVVHLAAQALVGESIYSPIWYWQRNVSDSLTLIEAMIQHGVKNIVFASSAAVYGWPRRMPGVCLPLDEEDIIHPCNPYGATKAAFETILRSAEQPHGIKSVSLRFFNAAGAAESGLIGEARGVETHIIPTILRSLSHYKLRLDECAPPHATIYGTDYDTTDGTCVRDYVHVEDLADGHAAALGYLLDGGASTVCNLGAGCGFSVMEILKKCEEITKMSIFYNCGNRRCGDPDTLVASNARASRVLNWRPRRSDLDTIIKSAWKWHELHPFGYRTGA